MEELRSGGVEECIADRSVSEGGEELRSGGNVVVRRRSGKGWEELKKWLE